MKKYKVSTLTKKLDTIFSKYIRLKHFDKKTQTITCVTCGTKKTSISDIHNGHFMSRRYIPTRWDENNCRPQCVSCNTYNQGRQYLFSLYLGSELSYSLYKKSREKKTFSIDELLEMIKYYENKVSKII